MSFLDEAIDPVHSDVDHSKIYTAEILLTAAILYPHEKEKFLNRIIAAKTNEDVDKIIFELREYQPIMGLDKIPTNVGEAAEATRLRVEREDFKERNK